MSDSVNMLEDKSNILNEEGYEMFSKMPVSFQWFHSSLFSIQILVFTLLLYTWHNLIPYSQLYILQHFCINTTTYIIHYCIHFTNLHLLIHYTTLLHLTLYNSLYNLVLCYALYYIIHYLRKYHITQYTILHHNLDKLPASVEWRA